MNFASQARNCMADTKPPPFFLNPLNPSHVQSACSSASHCMRLELEQILKFMNEHITALNLVLNEVQLKFSSLLRRVSEILKFAFTIHEP